VKIIIASRNPIKINATKLAFEQMFPDKIFQFEGVNISSDISDQPMSNNETLKGAINRSNNAKIECMDADYWIGIEGGVEKKGNEMQVFAWIYIQSKEMVGKARTATFDLPKKNY
jgi:inosine/xanthosine triphosphatase